MKEEGITCQRKPYSTVWVFGLICRPELQQERTMQTHENKVSAAINDLRNGKMVILIDHADREDEGDLIFPAETITPAIMNFIIRNSSGIVCLSLPQPKIEQLDLPFMVPPGQNSSRCMTPFTVSIDAKVGITTGVSAADRVKTILDAVADDAQPADLVKPGHIFPLQARAGGVLERAGHTEGALDMVQLAGFKPAAVLCEVMNPDGTMARGPSLQAFAEEHDIRILSIEDVIHYRLQHENLFVDSASAMLPLAQYGKFKVSVFQEKITNREHVVLFNEKSNMQQPPLVRLHSCCMTGDLFGSERCDCQQQLHFALEKISAEGGVLIYLNQEGRGIGLINKIKAYSLQEQGFDTVDANHELGWLADLRTYHVAAQILRDLKFTSIRLMTNNPHKIADLKKYGIKNIIRVPIEIPSNKHNKDYLLTKQNKLNHCTSINLSSCANEQVSRPPQAGIVRG
jgi:3,4-dihydroxy 2-butanone 4-phosphate synthase/GTP cyclohydrolase II